MEAQTRSMNRPLAAWERRAEKDVRAKYKQLNLNILHNMPDVGLFTATKPLDKGMKLVIKYSVEVEGLPVYSESYDVDTLAGELEKDEAKAVEFWSRRIKCVVACRRRPGFSACVTRCLTDGQACDCGHESCESIGPKE